MQKNQLNISKHIMAIKEKKQPAKFGFPPCNNMIFQSTFLVLAPQKCVLDESYSKINQADAGNYHEL